MKKPRIYRFILFSLLVIWIILSTYRTLYNFSKVYTEERHWVGKTDEEKRALQFGELHYLWRFIGNNTDNTSNILFFTNDLKAHYLGRYYLYPTKLIGEHEQHIWIPKAEYYDYILLYPVTNELMIKATKESNIKNYKLIKTFTTHSGKTAKLYKK